VTPALGAERPSCLEAYGDELSYTPAVTDRLLLSVGFFNNLLVRARSVLNDIGASLTRKWREDCAANCR